MMLSANTHIEAMYPAAAKLELFARRQRDGWVSWGNEIAAEVQSDMQFKAEWKSDQ